MLEKFAFELRRRNHKKVTTTGHMSRAKIIFTVKSTKWSKEEAEKWLYSRIEQNDYSDSTINKWTQTFNILSAVYDWKWQEKIKSIKENNKSPEMLSLDELKAFYSLDTKPKFNLIIRLAISTGARPSEILKLKLSEVDISRKVIIFNYTKTKESRIVILQDFIISELKRYIIKNRLSRDSCLFYYRDEHMPLNIKSLENEFKHRLKILGINKNITPYSMRHAYLTRMASQVNIWVLKELVGHKRITTTEKYIHNNEFMLRSASERDVLFDDLRDFRKKGEYIIKLINQLIETGKVDQIKASEAILHLRQSLVKL